MTDVLERVLWLEGWDSGAQVFLSRPVVGHEVNVTSCSKARLIGAGYETSEHRNTGASCRTRCPW
jgi:hypothetical protein